MKNNNAKLKFKKSQRMTLSFTIVWNPTLKNNVRI